jgi:hypothetical protein
MSSNNTNFTPDTSSEDLIINVQIKTLQKSTLLTIFKKFKCVITRL